MSQVGSGIDGALNRITGRRGNDLWDGGNRIDEALADGSNRRIERGGYRVSGIG